ncbi:TonB-dependent receptor domain-containing protein [Tenacibaculum amylolyticum]|uniref:TonB-dependent receptor domain-containing protein n=1 Tax=Tenacibaculum amylolyticum TaxID=104269 RepID=UPI003892FC2F
MKRLVVLIGMLSSFSFFSQTIKGTVKDNFGTIAFADIILKDTSNAIITGTTSNDDGTFSLEVKKGKYVVIVSFLGYENWTKQVLVENTIDLGSIILKENIQNLDEVVITATKRSIERKVDRLVFNVEKSVVAEGGSGIDLLKIAPRVQIQNGTVEILGKGVSRVLINGRLSPLEGEELTTFLEGLNGSDIKSIEVITNPPAKYEAAGSGGLINIVLKKAVANSWNNTSRVVYNQNTYNFGSFRNNFSYNKNKVAIVASVNATKGHHLHTEDLQIQYPVNFWDIDIESKERDDNYSGRFQLDYQVSEKTNLGFQYLGNLRKPGGFTTVTSNVFDGNNQLDRWIENKGDNKIETRNNAINIHLDTKLDSLGRAISIDADYFQYNSNNDRDFTTEVFDNSGTSLGISSAALNISDQNIENFSSKIDVTYPVDNVQLSFGTKASFTITESSILFFNTLSGTQILDYTRSNNFMYKENNFAGYVSASSQLSEKLQIKLGARVESTITEGVSREMAQTNTNNYTKLFPTIYVSYKKNDNHSFNLSYGKRINRPRFSDLNPFRYYINDNSFGEGNPFLQPSFTDSFEVSHAYKRIVNSSVFLNVTTDGFGVVFTSDINDETQIVTRENYFTQYNYGFTQSFSYTKEPWWESQNGINLLGYYTKFTKDFGTTPKNGMQVILSSNNTFSLSKNAKFIVNSWYSTAHNRGLYSVGKMFDLSLGYQHTFPESNLKLAVFANDIFNTSFLNNYTSIVNGVEQVYGQNSSTRNLTVSLAYSFGNKKIKIKNRNFGNDEERNRSN